jgi:hypothetical protein
MATIISVIYRTVDESLLSSHNLFDIVPALPCLLDVYQYWLNCLVQGYDIGLSFKFEF